MAVDYQDALDRAGADVRNKVGQVLSSESVIMDLRDRAGNLRATQNTQVNAQAEAVYQIALGLLDNYKSIEGDSVTLLGKIGDEDKKITTDPLWIAIQQGDYQSTLGWAALARATDYIGEAVSLTQQAATLSGRADDHLSRVDNLKTDVGNLEDFAQGKGFKALVSTGASAISSALSFGTSYVNMIEYAAIAVGLFFVWDLAKPFVVARNAARRNPYRRRRHARR